MAACRLGLTEVLPILADINLFVDLCSLSVGRDMTIRLAESYRILAESFSTDGRDYSFQKRLMLAEGLLR